MNRSLGQYLAAAIIPFCFWTVIIFALLFLPDFTGITRTRRSISLYLWTDMVDIDMIERFQEKTGIKVYLSYFESNEELLVKLQATGGAGYDLMVPSDYIMESLITQGLVKKLDTSRLNIMDRINPHLLNLYFDPGNQYSIPYYWAVYGIGVDVRYFDDKTPTATWGLLFNNQKNPYKLAMINVAREAVLMGALYKYGSIEGITPERLMVLKKLLTDQKQKVEVYADSLTEYFLLSQICPVIVTTTPFMWRPMKKNKHIEFLFPQEGSFNVIDSFVMSRASQNDDLVYEFLNFIYSPEIIRHHFDLYTFLPATVDLFDLFREYEVPASIVNAHQNYDKLNFFRPVIAEEWINKIWLDVKAS